MGERVAFTFAWIISCITWVRLNPLARIAALQFKTLTTAWQLHTNVPVMRIAILFALALAGSRLLPAQTTFLPIGGNRVTSDASGNVYVAVTQGTLPTPYESPSSQVTILTKFDNQGDVLWAYPLAGLVTAVAVNSQGDLLFAAGSTVNALDTSGNLLYTTTLETAVAGVPTTIINGLTLDASGNVYVTRRDVVQ